MGEVARKTNGMVTRYAVSKTIRSENGPSCDMCKKYQKFAEEFKTKHITSGSHHPQSSGMVERTEGTVIKMWAREKDELLALMI